MNTMSKNTYGRQGVAFLMAAGLLVSSGCSGSGGSAASIAGGIPGSSTVVSSTQIPAGADVLFQETFDGRTNSIDVSQATTWDVGVPSSGPFSAVSGAKVLATTLEGSHPDAVDARIATPSIQLPAGKSIELRFQHFFDAERAIDGGQVMISTDGGVRFGIVNPRDSGYPEAQVAALGSSGFSGTSNGGAGFEEAAFDLSAYAGQDVVIAFRFAADEVNASSGWYVDDIVVFAEDAAQAAVGQTATSGNSNSSAVTAGNDSGQVAPECPAGSNSGSTAPAASQSGSVAAASSGGCGSSSAAPAATAPAAPAAQSASAAPASSGGCGS